MVNPQLNQYGAPMQETMPIIPPLTSKNLTDAQSYLIDNISKASKVRNFGFDAIAKLADVTGMDTYDIAQAEMEQELKTAGLYDAPANAEKPYVSDPTDPNSITPVQAEDPQLAALRGARDMARADYIGYNPTLPENPYLQQAQGMMGQQPEMPTAQPPTKPNAMQMAVAGLVSIFAPQQAGNIMSMPFQYGIQEADRVLKEQMGQFQYKSQKASQMIQFLLSRADDETRRQAVIIAQTEKQKADIYKMAQDDLSDFQADKQKTAALATKEELVFYNKFYNEKLPGVERAGAGKQYNQARMARGMSGIDDNMILYTQANDSPYVQNIKANIRKTAAQKAKLISEAKTIEELRPYVVDLKKWQADLTQKKATNYERYLELQLAKLDILLRGSERQDAGQTFGQGKDVWDSEFKAKEFYDARITAGEKIVADLEDEKRKTAGELTDAIQAEKVAKPKYRDDMAAARAAAVIKDGRAGRALRNAKIKLEKKRKEGPMAPFDPTQALPGLGLGSSAPLGAREMKR